MHVPGCHIVRGPVGVMPSFHAARAAATDGMAARAAILVGWQRLNGRTHVHHQLRLRPILRARQIRNLGNVIVDRSGAWMCTANALSISRYMLYQECSGGCGGEAGGGGGHVSGGVT